MGLDEAIHGRLPPIPGLDRTRISVWQIAGIHSTIMLNVLRSPMIASDPALNLALPAFWHVRSGAVLVDQGLKVRNPREGGD